MKFTMERGLIFSEGHFFNAPHSQKYKLFVSFYHIIPLCGTFDIVSPEAYHCEFYPGFNIGSADNYAGSS